MKFVKSIIIFTIINKEDILVIRKIAKDALARGVEVLDAPVSGGATGADSKRLSIIVGGKMEVLGKIHKILEAVGDKIFGRVQFDSADIPTLLNIPTSVHLVSVLFHCSV